MDDGRGPSSLRLFVDGRGGKTGRPGKSVASRGMERTGLTCSRALGDGDSLRKKDIGPFSLTRSRC